jgi:Na+/melibiose symporter-like transporter
MSDGWLYYFVSIVCLASALVLFSLDAACSSGGSSSSNGDTKRLPPLVSLRRWLLIVGMVLSVTGLAMFVTGISVDKDAELVNRDTYFALGGIALGVSLCLLFIAVSVSTYRQVTVQLSPEDGSETRLDLLDPEPSTQLDLLDPEPSTQLDILEPETTKLDLLEPETATNLDLLDPYEQ